MGTGDGARGIMRASKEMKSAWVDGSGMVRKQESSMIDGWKKAN